MSDFTLNLEPLNHPDVVQLIAELDAYVATLYPPEENFFDLYEADAVVVAREHDGTAIGCGAIRRIEHPTRHLDTAEVKRMFTREAARQRGVARAIMHELERVARDKGFGCLVLETGNLQPIAVALYESLDFVQIPLFGKYLTSTSSICFEKVLD